MIITSLEYSPRDVKCLGMVEVQLNQMNQEFIHSLGYTPRVRGVRDMDVQISGYITSDGRFCSVELTRHRVVEVSPTRIVWQHEGRGAWWLTFEEQKSDNLEQSSG